jgi:hypothetical protein
LVINISCYLHIDSQLDYLRPLGWHTPRERGGTKDTHLVSRIPICPPD